jgi:signal transduction histidine kinase
MVAFSIVMPLGVFLGWLSYWLTSNTSLSISHYSGIVITYLSVIIFGGLFAHRKEQLQQEKMRIIETVSASLSHELRTPLSAINLGNSATKEYLNDLIDTYHLAKNAGLPVKSLRNSQFEILQSALQGIEASMKYASVILSMLLVSSEQSKIKKEHFTLISISNCIEEALKRYPFLSDEKSLVNWEKGPDFYFIGNEVLTMHIVFNLLKNSIYYTKAAGKGNIRIWLETENKINKLYFRDTGQGIPQDILPHVFDRFFTTTHHGSGIGLAFCKAVMQAYGGEIKCSSVENDYTEFVLIFPYLPESA